MDGERWGGSLGNVMGELMDMPDNAMRCSEEVPGMTTGHDFVRDAGADIHWQYC